MDDRPFGPSNRPHPVHEPVSCARLSEPLEPVRSDGKTSAVELFSRAKNGDLSAFEALVERLRDDVYGLGLRMTRSETDAAEIAQETFLSAYWHLNNVLNETQLSAWVRQVAASHAWSRARLLQKTASAGEQLNLPISCASTFPAKQRGPDWSADALERPLSPELQRTIEQAMDRLPQSHRGIFLLKDVAELSYEQVANLTGESISAVRSRLRQARLSLRESIDRFYGEQ